MYLLYNGFIEYNFLSNIKRIVFELYRVYNNSNTINYFVLNVKTMRTHGIL